MPWCESVFAGTVTGLAWYWLSLASLCACMAAKPSISSEKMSRWLMVFIVVNLQSTLIIVCGFPVTSGRAIQRSASLFFGCTLRAQGHQVRWQRISIQAGPTIVSLDASDLSRHKHCTGRNHGFTDKNNWYSGFILVRPHPKLVKDALKCNMLPLKPR